MAQIRKKEVLNKRGIKIRLNDAALEIAMKHFGVNQSRSEVRAVPLELLRLPKKIEIIKAVREPIVLEKLEDPIEIPVVQEIKKPGRKKKDEGTNKQKE